MPPSKAILSRIFERDNEAASTLSSAKAESFFKDEKKNEKAISLSTIIIIGVAIVFGINAIS
jgi:hypothetical protein